jgi:hypothetical protein
VAADPNLTRAGADAGAVRSDRADADTVGSTVAERPSSPSSTAARISAFTIIVLV